MWFNKHTPMSLVGLSTILLARPIVASFIPEIFQNLDILQNVEKRCANPCGYYGQLCCSSGQYCYTDSAGQAQCGNGQAATTVNNGGQWVYYTTTYVMTDLQTVTTTYSSYVGVQTVAATTLSCAYAQGQTPCGNVCCLSGQYCQTSGSCVAVPGGSSGYYSSLYTVTTIVTNTASAPLRPTTQTVLTLTSTGTAVRTTAFQTPSGTGGAVLSGATQTSGGLSGGAIAGIVIGVIAGILILLLLCACFCFKELLDGLLAIFGLGDRRRKRTEEVYIEERHSRHGSGAGRKWFGQPGRTEVIEEKKESSGIKRMVGVAAVLGGLAAALGLKRRADRRDSVSSGSYDYDYSSESSPSSVTRSRSRNRSRR